VIGTVAYMSPEQALDTRSADQRSDIYSLGCTLFFLLTGRSLYHEETGMKTLLAHREQAVPSIREFCEEAPVSLDAVFRTMVAKRPADRLQSMTEVVAALDACVPGLATNLPAAIAPRPATSAPLMRVPLARGWNRWRSSPLRIGLAIALLAGLAAGTYLAGILIRIKTKHGTTEIHVDDPDAEVTVTQAGTQATSFQSLVDARKSPVVTKSPVATKSATSGNATPDSTLEEAVQNKDEEIAHRQARIQKLEVENQQLRAAADDFGVRVGSGLTKGQRPEAAPEAFVVPRPQAAVSSVDGQVAQWLFNTPFTLICLHENPTRVISRIEEFPAGNAAIEAIFVGQGTRPAFHYQEADVERLASLGQLKWLSLKSPTVTDAFVVRLKSLKGLEGLSLASASITDECLPALAEMTRLSSLDLSGCGGITDAGLKHLASLKSLNDLTLAASGEDLKKSWAGLGREFGGPPLPRLVLDYTQTTEAGLVKLQQALPNCSISALHILPGMGVPLPPPPGSSDRAWGKWILQHVNRCWLYADVDPETAIAGPKDLPPIDFHIERIRFGATNDPRPVLNAFLFRRLGELSHLRGLQIDRKVTGPDLRGLEAIKSLRSLGLGEGSAGNDSLRPLASLTGLTALTMQGSELTDEGLKSLAPLKGLAQLAIDGRARNLHGTGFDALVGNTALRSLNLTGAGIDDDGARQIARLTGLESLDLADTWIGGTGLAELSKLKHLKSLNLRFCRRLRSADLAPLVGLPALEDLTLTDCRINNDAVTLTKLTKLKTLKLDGTGLSAAAISELRQILPQTSITPSVQ
jgi:eukaryotic-like serine/threonine-protein kinase